jgi:hypothetical protein
MRAVPMTLSMVNIAQEHRQTGCNSNARLSGSGVLIAQAGGRSRSSLKSTMQPQVIIFFRVKVAISTS